MHVQFKARPSALSAAHMAGRTTNISDTPLGSSIHHTGLTHGLALSGTITVGQKSKPPCVTNQAHNTGFDPAVGGLERLYEEWILYGLSSALHCVYNTDRIPPSTTTCTDRNTFSCFKLSVFVFIVVYCRYTVMKIVFKLDVWVYRCGKLMVYKNKVELCFFFQYCHKNGLWDFFGNVFQTHSFLISSV